nr:MAG TPA: hypothetical protein [Caudoviricetes sp.]
MNCKPDSPPDQGRRSSGPGGPARLQTIGDRSLECCN